MEGVKNSDHLSYRSGGAGIFEGTSELIWEMWVEMGDWNQQALPQ
jgi:hypothetical protein